MLSREDSRRLAQLERQLLREDPEFCARMSAGQPTVPHRRKHPPISLILTALVAWVAALTLGVIGWWPAAILAALCATGVVVGMLHHAKRRNRRANPA